MANSQKERITEHLQDTYGTEAEHLWTQYPEYSVFRHPISRKWYALFASIPESKLGLAGERRVDVLDIKCSSILVGSLLAEKGFFPAYHMNKKTWILVLLDGSVPDEEIMQLLELAYDSVAPKSIRKKENNEEISDLILKKQ